MASRKSQGSESTRRFRRQTVRVLVDYVSDRGVTCDYATTLGAGGLFLESEDLLDCGASIKMRFRLPRGEVLHEVEGRIVWARAGARGDTMHAPGMGVQFTDRAASAKLARDLEDWARLGDG